MINICVSYINLCPNITYFGWIIIDNIIKARLIFFREGLYISIVMYCKVIFNYNIIPQILNFTLLSTIGY